MGKKADCVFQRIEKKYLMTVEQCAAFQKAIEPYMQLDQFGLHTICNIYYDTNRDELIRRSIEKPPYKEKLRLRTYGVPVPWQESFIELKKKYDKVVYKRREMLPLNEAMAYLNHGVKPSKDTQILREVQYFMDFYKPVPKLYLAYDRQAYFGKEDPQLRLTIDHRIRSREYDLDLTCGDYGEKYFQDNEKVLEIKVAQAFPLWLSHILAELEIYPVSFSKYGSIFKKEHLEREGAVIMMPQVKEHKKMAFA